MPEKIDTELRSKSLEWFFALDESERFDLKQKHFPDKHIEHSAQWGFHYTLGQIEEMFSSLTSPIVGEEME